ncbi:MAG TPA: hypothetical protein VFS11_05810 [Gemmatimonadales bacterium]|nr:hypothetical protein [Gemmatimonadales bacterium]
MPVGTVPLGPDAVITVSTTSGGTYSPISDLDNYSFGNKRNTTKRSRFQNATQLTVSGSTDRTLTLSGMNSVGDTGQGVLKAAFTSQDDVFIKLLPDGTNGWTIQGKVSDASYSGKPDDAGEASFEISISEDPVEVGTP